MASVPGSSFIVVALLVTGCQAAADPADAACHQTVDAAAKSPAEERSYEVYNHCRMNRPAGGIVGEADAANDCTQLAHLYEVAAHYSKGSEVSSKDFCMTVEEYRADTEAGVQSGKKLLADHGSCMVMVRKMLASQEVGEAASDSCKRLFPGTAPARCALYAEEIAVASGEAEVAKICDKAVRGHETKSLDDKAVRGHETKSLEEQRFIYSCVQYASNLIASQKDTSPEARAKSKADVEKNCRSHLPAGDQNFCDDYSDLIQKRASREELQSFCDVEYKKMHAGKESSGAATTTVAPSQAPQTSTSSPQAQPSSTIRLVVAPQPVPVDPKQSQKWSQSFKMQPEAVAKVVHLGVHLPGGESWPIFMNHVASNKSTVETSTGEQAACEDHMDRLGKVHLPTNSKKKIIETECHQRYKKSTQACTDAAERILIGDSVAACHLLTRTENVNKSSFGMAAMCKETVANVASLNLLGEALRETALDMCTQDFSGALHKPPTAPGIVKGCSFFADRLADAYSKGPVDKSAFCSSLGKKKEQRASPQEAQPVAAVAVKPKRHVNTKKPSVSLLRKAQKENGDDSESDEAHDSHGSEADQGNFLNSFLDSYDAKKDDAKKDDAEKDDAAVDAHDEQKKIVSKKKSAVDEQQGEDAGALSDVDSTLAEDADDPLASIEKAVSSDDADAPKVSKKAAPSHSPSKKKEETADDGDSEVSNLLQSKESDAEDSGEGDDKAADKAADSSDDGKASTSSDEDATNENASKTTAAPTDADDTEVAKAPAAPSSDGDGDVDSLVSSFLSRTA